MTPLIHKIFNRKFHSRSDAKDALSKKRRGWFEHLEERALLSATPLASYSSMLAQYSAMEAGIETVQFVNATREVQEVLDVSSVTLSEPIAALEGFDIDYSLLEDGNVRVLGQTGLQQVSTMTYCTIPDALYIDLWEDAISRWEDVVAVGVEDTTYPYEVNGESNLEIDDLYLYLGFSESFSSASSLGSALNAGYYRDGGTGVAATGSLVFNANYFVSNPSQEVQTVFYNTALHEIAHALGYNISNFQRLGLLESASDVPYNLDDLFPDSGSSANRWYYVGEKGVEQYLQSYPEDFLSETISQDRYLMETYGASGSFGAHLSSVLGTYYLYLNQRDGMTYSISPKFEATITPMTLGVLEDMGYTVNYDYADSLGSPVPEHLTSEVVGKTVVLNWQTPSGDLSNVTSGDARYQIERLDVLAQYDADAEADWVVVATDVEGTTYYDSTVKPGREYAYRVRSNYIRSNEEVGVFRAKAGDMIEWESDESKFTIYALVNNGSDMLTWTRVVNSTNDKNWTVTSLPQTPEDGTTLFRVVAVGKILTDTHPSRVSNAAVSTRAGAYVPEGYDADDWNAVKNFLEITDDNGVKNGYKIDGASYSPDFLQNVTGLTWTEIDGVYRLTTVSWKGYDLVGDLDLSDSSQLTRIVIEDNSISKVELGSYRLTQVNVASNNLTTLNVKGLVGLESLNCSDNNIADLDVSNNLKLLYLDCSDNEISELETSDNWELVTLKCDGNAMISLSVAGNDGLATLNPWNAGLTYVYLPSGFTGTVDLSDSNSNSYTWVKSGETVGSDGSFTFDGSDITVVATLDFDDATQTVYFYVGHSGDVPNAPSDLVFGELNGSNLTISWIDNAVGEIGYKVYYTVNDGDWCLAESVVSSPEVSASTGTVIERTAIGVDPSNTYQFKVVAYALDSTGNEAESAPLIGVYASSDTQLEAPTNFVAYDYDLDALTLQLAWDKVDDAAYYEVQYRRSDDGGETWRNAWTRSEILSDLSRTAIYVHEDSFYGFRVRAISSVGATSEWSELTFSHVPTLDDITHLAVTDFDKYSQSAQLLWNPVETAVHYEIQYRISNDGGMNWQNWTIAEKTFHGTSRVARDMYAPCTYEFRVRARDSNNERSAWSHVTFTYEEPETGSAALIDLAFEQVRFSEDGLEFFD